jgi:hypothetical protein
VAVCRFLSAPKVRTIHFFILHEYLTSPMPRSKGQTKGPPGDPYSYYARNRERVLQRQRERREDPVFREKQRAYCAQYYKDNKAYIIARAKAKRMGLPYKSKKLERVPRFEIVYKDIQIAFD